MSKYHDLHYQGPEYKTVIEDNGSKLETSTDIALPDAVTLGVIVGACVAGLVILLILIIILARRCNSRRSHGQKLIDLGLGDERTLITSRSAPSTRTPSPYRAQTEDEQQAKTNPSTPNTTRKVATPKDVGTVKMSMMPDFQVPFQDHFHALSAQDEVVQGGSDVLHFHTSLLGHLKPDTYGSLTVNSDGDDEIHGQLWFTVMYDPSIEELQVQLLKAANLKPRKQGAPQRDPFVKIFLLPDEKNFKQSKMVKRTLSPKYNETFVFLVGAADVFNRTLRLSVYDVDKRRVRHTLGHVFLNLDELDLSRHEIIIRDLETASQVSAGLGELNTQLTYTASSERLKVSVLRARGLKKTDFDSDTGVYARIQLMFGQRTHKTKRTSLHVGTSEPLFNETFTFSLRPKQLDSCSVRIILVAQSTRKETGHEEEYGRTVIGSYMHARGDELAHWQEMVASPRQPITRWHMLNSENSGSRVRE